MYGSHDHEPDRRPHDRAFGHGPGFGGPGSITPGGRGFGLSRSHHHGVGFQNLPGFGRGGFGPGIPGFGPGLGGPRKRRGDVRLAILSLLADAPSNGYNLIKTIGERTGGTWNPSPGSVYPTLQQLVDEELVETTGEGRRTEFQLTETGRAYVTEHADELAGVWASSEQRAAQDAGLGESTAKLMAAVGQLRFGASEEQRRKAAAILDDARKALYGILAE